MADPVIERRAAIARWCAIGRRVGWGLIALAVVVFAVGAVTGFSDAVIVTVVAALAASAVALIPAVIFGYGVSAAEKEDRGEPFTY